MPEPVTTEPFIFVSYSHEDERHVRVEIDRLREHFGVWFDHGISPGGAWREELAERIVACRLFILYVTPRSAQSEHCLNEVNFALESGIPVLAIHLEETNLSPGMKLALGSRQAVMKHAISEIDYHEQLDRGISHYFERKGSAGVGPAKTGRKPLAFALAGLVVVVSMALAWVFLDPDGSSGQLVDAPAGGAPAAASPPVPDGQSAPLPERQSPAIAVLPFVNMSNDPDNEYFSDGISEEILNALVNTRTVDVIARTSSFQFKGQNLSVQKIADILKISHLLEGSVRKSGNRVRITAQLIEANTGVHLWSRTFDRELIDVFLLQDEIATAIVAEIADAMGYQEAWDTATIESRGFQLSKQRGVDPAAYDLYLRALYNASTSTTAEEFFRSTAMLEQVTTIDPGFADAWYMLAQFYSWPSDQSPRTKAEVVRPALQKALSLDPDNARALALMAWIQGPVDLRWREAEVMLRKAVALAPSDAGLRSALGSFLGLTNRRLESLGEVALAYRLDPLNVEVVTTYASRLMWAARHKDAASVLATVEGIFDHSLAVSEIARVYLTIGDPERAVHYVGILRTQLGADSTLVKVRERGLAVLQNDMTRRDELDHELRSRSAKGDYVPAFGWNSDHPMQQAAAGVANRDVETGFALLAFYGDSGADLREEMNLSDFEVRDVRAASAAERATYEARRVSLTRDALDAYAGYYVADNEGYAHEFYREGDAFMLFNPGDSFRGELIPVSDNHFVNPCCVGYEYTFERDRNGRWLARLIDSQYPVHEMRHTVQVDPVLLRKLCGRYQSADMTTTLHMEGAQLMATGDFGSVAVMAVGDNLYYLPLIGGAVKFTESLDGYDYVVKGLVQEFRRVGPAGTTVMVVDSEAIL